jgi:hypothetical protein
MIGEIKNKYYYGYVKYDQHEKLEDLLLAIDTRIKMITTNELHNITDKLNIIIDFLSA